MCIALCDSKSDKTKSGKLLQKAQNLEIEN